MAKISNINEKNLVKIDDERLGKDQSYSLSSVKIRNELNWNDKVSLDQGIYKTQQWILKNINKIQKLSFNYIHKK